MVRVEIILVVLTTGAAAFFVSMVIATNFRKYENESQSFMLTWICLLIRKKFSRYNTKLFLVEVCSSDIESVINAAEAEVDSIEISSNLNEGGITPSSGFIKQAILAIQKCSSGRPIELHVLLRPRVGDFYYSNIEFNSILQDVKDLPPEISGIFYK